MTTTFLREGITSQTMLLITGQSAGQGAILTIYDSTKSYISLALDHPELLALLRALPTDLLVEVLGERGVLCTMGGEAPDVAAGLDALIAEQSDPPEDDTAPHLHWCFKCRAVRRCHRAACEVMTASQGLRLMTSQGLRCSTPILCPSCGGTGLPTSASVPTPGLGAKTAAPANLFFALDEPTLGKEDREEKPMGNLVHFHHFYDSSHHPVVTVCRVVNGQRNGYGWAITSPSDMPCKRTGRAIARQRAQAALNGHGSQGVTPVADMWFYDRPIRRAEALVTLGRCGLSPTTLIASLPGAMFTDRVAEAERKEG